MAMPSGQRSNATKALRVEALQEAAAETFAHSDLRHVCWAGVFGSVAKGTSDEDSSDVDVVVITSPEDPSLPPDAPFLQDALPRTWGRPVDVVLLEKGQKELQGYIQLEALLSSRTIYLRDDQARTEVKRLRLLASSLLDEAHHLFTNVINHIYDVKKLVDGVSLEVYSGHTTTLLFRILTVILLAGFPENTT